MTFPTAFLGSTPMYWISHIGSEDEGADEDRAERELKRLGAAAVPALVALLRHPEHGYRAAMLLGEIGRPAATAAISALIQTAKRTKNHFTRGWSIDALAKLDQLDAVMAFAKQPRFWSDVVSALKDARPASYPLYEQLLSRKDRKLSALIASELSPGNAMYEPIAPGFDVIAGATKSTSAALRKDAAIALGSYKQIALRKRAVPVLSALLADKDADVRRLAVMALSDCKSAARPALAQIRALLRDTNAKVRMWAKEAIKAIEPAKEATRSRRG